MTVIHVVNGQQSGVRYFRRFSLGGISYALKHSEVIVPQAPWLTEWWLGYLSWPLYENFVCLLQDTAI
jgi:hypothetical protein